ncbi:MAG: cytidine deaminase [Acidobacteriota bacterium]
MKTPERPDWPALTAAAWKASEAAYAPYSNFRVGAALWMPNGEIFAGCNVENRSFGMTLCAERTAAVSAVVAGHRRFLAAVVVADSKEPPRPCGLCLGTLIEFGDEDLAVRLLNRAGQTESFRLGELMPYPFSADELND